MPPETKSCQACKQKFVIASDDFEFYKKIGVPAPTWCPDCRMQRRMTFRNERGLHRRKCSATGKDIVSIYRPDAPYTVYSPEYWWSDSWDPMQYGKEYDFSRPFFEQFNELMRKAPTISLFDSKSTNTSFCNVVVEHKNCYLVSAGWNNEDCMYINRAAFCKNSLDLYVCNRNEFCYENIFCSDCYQVNYGHTSDGCNNSSFLYDCRACSNCFGCVNLRSKQYCIFNEQYTKEEYFEKLKQFDLGNHRVVEEIKRKVAELRLKGIHKYAQITNSQNTTGDHLVDTRNGYHCFDFLDGADNVKYCHWGSGTFKDSYDAGPGTGGNSELLYEGVSIGVSNSNCKFGFIVWYSQNITYGFNCQSSNNLFGCANLRGKSYCILNKQYTKEEYEALVPKIIAQMNEVPYVDAKGRTYKYGEFFPPEISPFAYNDTVAQDFFPLTKETATQQGFKWGETSERNYQVTIKAADLPVNIKDVADEITKAIIGCADEGKCNDGCTMAFRITPDELSFYRKMNLPLPRLCFNCRHWTRLRQRTPLKLWTRLCDCQRKGDYQNTMEHFHEEDPCPNEFETTFSPDQKEIVYCLACYQAEIA